MSYTMIGAIFHVLGVYFSKSCHLSNFLLFSIIGICITFTTGILRKRINSALIIAFIMLSVGGVSYSVASQNKLYDTFPDKYVDVVGTIISTPMKSDGEYCNKYIVEPSSVSYLNKNAKTRQRLIVRTKVPFNYGDIIEFSGFLTELADGNNEYDSDYSKSYKSKGIFNQLSAFEVKKIGEISPINPKYWIGSIRNFIYQAIFHNYSGEKAAIYNAILLGDKTYFSDSYTIKLLHTGVWQALYSPYIHIIILTLIAGLFGTSRKKNHILLILLLVYAVANTGSANVLKSSLLAMSVILCRGIFGYSDKAQQLSFLVLAITMINPMLCYNRGFVMSVLSSVILLAFFPAVYKIVSGKSRKYHGKCGKLASVISVALTLVLCTSPLSAYMFNGIASFSTVISTMMIPVIFTVIFLSILYIPALHILSSGGFLDNVIYGILTFLEALPSYIEKIPGHYISLKTPTILQIITVYLVLWLCIQLLGRYKRDDTFKVVSAITLAFMLCSCFFSQSPGLEIYFVNVGQGDAAILHTSVGETILMDGGGASDYQDSNYNVGDKVLVPYMISHGFTDIDYAIVTHFHKDHAEGIISAVNNLTVKNIVMPDSNPQNEYRAILETLAKEKNINIIYAQKDGMISFKSGLKLQFLAPDNIQRLSNEPNDTSIVTQVNYYQFCGLFTGDTTDTADEGYPRYIDLLKVAHHGSDTASSESDINHLCPKYAVISVGKNNSYDLPAEAVLETLENVKANILRTDIMGDIRFKIHKNGKITYKTLRME